MAKCPSCKFEVPSGASHCGYCGNEIPRISIFETIIGFIVFMIIMSFFT
jgi:hypothetical protein